MSTFNLARHISGPAILDYAGARFYSKSPILSNHTLQTFNVAVEGHGDEVSKRVSGQELVLELTPAGEWENLSVLFPHRTAALGSYVTPVLKVASINTTSNEMTVTGHGLTTADAVGLGMINDGSGTPALPTLGTGSITNTGVYYVRVVDANTLKLYASAANASSDTSAFDFSDDGTGTLRLIVQRPLTIYPLDGSNPIRFENVGIIDMPEITLSVKETLLGAVRFQAFPQHGKSTDGANAFYTATGISTVSDTNFDPTAIKTLPYTVAWGATAPWDDIKTTSGVKIKPTLALSDVSDDGDGVRTKRIDNLMVSAKFTPLGIGHEDLLTKLGIHGLLGRAVGGSSPDNLNISYGSDVYVRVYGAALLGGPAAYSSKEGRLRELDLYAQRTFSAGTANPLFYVGTTSP